MGSPWVLRLLCELAGEAIKVNMTAAAAQTRTALRGGNLMEDLFSPSERRVPRHSCTERGPSHDRFRSRSLRPPASLQVQRPICFGVANEDICHGRAHGPSTKMPLLYPLKPLKLYRFYAGDHYAKGPLKHSWTCESGLTKCFLVVVPNFNSN